MINILLALTNISLSLDALEILVEFVTAMKVPAI